MRVAWFTPFSEGSAIGRCGLLIVRELAKRAEVDLWHPPTANPIQTDIPRRPFDSLSPADVADLSAYDLVVYNHGNYLPYHKEIFRASRLVPGVSVLHDFVMHNFFAAYFREELRDREAYMATVRKHYGEGGCRAVEESSRIGVNLWDSPEVVNYPLFEEALGCSTGVIVHSQFFLEKAAPLFAGPIARFSLPPNSIARFAVRSRESLGLPADRILLVSAGRLVPNKRIESVLQTLASEPRLSDRVHYVVIGQHDPGYAPGLISFAAGLGLSSTVRFIDSASDEVFQSHLAHADVFINLRYPPTEGASGSCIEQMLSGRPVIVTDTGFFSELPDDCVLKIPPDREFAGLSAALWTLVNDADARSRLGEKARSYAEREFRADKYAQSLLDFAQEVSEAAPILGAADRMAAELKLLGVTADSPIPRGLAAEIHSLFRRPAEDKST
jgi:glycosyltransferase involved in cell wall biosynthesis